MTRVKYANHSHPQPILTPERDDDWMLDATCADYTPEQVDDMWFDTSIAGQGRNIALGICKTCPVVTQCLIRARDLSAIHGIQLSGVWGGRYLGGGHSNGTSTRASKKLREVEG